MDAAPTPDLPQVPASPAPEGAQGVAPDVEHVIWARSTIDASAVGATARPVAPKSPPVEPARCLQPGRPLGAGRQLGQAVEHALVQFVELFSINGHC